MFKALKKWWKYMAAWVSGSLNERADPKVQLEQAIMEAQEQHRRLREQAANPIRNQKPTEKPRNPALAAPEKANTNARQAAVLAHAAAKTGATGETTACTHAAG